MIQMPEIKTSYNPSNERIPKNWSGDRCFCCNRPVSFSTCYWIHLNTDGNLYPTKESSTPKSQGWFPLGSHCGKQIKRGYKTKKLPWLKK